LIYIYNPIENINPNNVSYCPNCLERVSTRESGCNHVTHNCISIQNTLYKDALNGKGGFPPFYYSSHETTHLCVVCAELDWQYSSYNNHTPGAYNCNKGSNYKYYRLYSIIQKFIELQPAPNTVSPLTIRQAMNQVIEAGNNAPNIPSVFLPIVASIKLTGTFLPSKHPFTNDKTFLELYPPIRDRIKKIPNMRKMNDVLENNLMPEIITYTEVKNKDGTSKDPKEYNSPNCDIEFDTHEKFIIFNHREYLLDNNYKKYSHQNISADSFTHNFKSQI
jgi:hypothetical protein